MDINNSTGPKTEKGKAVSSQNALKHGLYSDRCLIEDEDWLDFEDLRFNIERTLAPQGPVERELVRRITDAAWRLRRIVRIEGKLFNYNIEAARKQDLKFGKFDHFTTGHHLAKAFEKIDTRNLGGYESKIELSMFRNLQLLEKLQKVRNPGGKFPASLEDDG